MDYEYLKGLDLKYPDIFLYFHSELLYTSAFEYFNLKTNDEINNIRLDTKILMKALHDENKDPISHADENFINDYIAIFFPFLKFDTVNSSACDIACFLLMQELYLFLSRYKNLNKLEKDYHLGKIIDLSIIFTAEQVALECNTNNRRNILAEHCRKMAKKRHLKNNEIKEAILQEWSLNAGKISKNQFAKKMAAKYHISEITIRKNWLQGLDVE